MTSKFKTLGLAMVALLAMSVVVASAAQAQFTASEYPATVTGHASTVDIYVDGSVLACTEHLEGTMSEPSSTVTISTYYLGCAAFGFASATVNMNGCDFVYHDTGSNFAGQITISCPEGKKITITAGNCEVQIGAQGPLSSVSYSTSGSNVNVQANATSITANRTKDGFLCPLTGTGHVSNAIYRHEAPVTVSRVGGGSISVD